MKQINYNNINCPINLMKMMDSKCRNLLVVLLMIEFEERSNTFNVSSKTLQILTGYCKHVLNATLSALHRNGIITVECKGIGKGIKQPTNTITINYDKFKEYDEQYITITKLLDESQHIVIDDYRVKGYKVSYLPIEEQTEQQTSNTEIETEPIVADPELSQKEENDVVPASPATATATVDNKDITDIPTADKGVIAANPFYEKIEYNENTTTDTLSNCTTDIKREVMNNFNPEEIIQFAKDNKLSLYSSGIVSPRCYRLQNKKAFEIIENTYGEFEEKQVEDLWHYSKVNGISF